MFHFLNESIIAAFYGVILIGTMKGVDMLSEENSYLCINIVTAAWALNMVVSVLNNAVGIVRKIKIFIRKRRENVHGSAYVVRTTPEDVIKPKGHEKTMTDKTCSEKMASDSDIIIKRHAKPIENIDWFA